jgi:hypothetical protein
MLEYKYYLMTKFLWGFSNDADPTLVLVARESGCVANISGTHSAST